MELLGIHHDDHIGQLSVLQSKKYQIRQNPSKNPTIFPSLKEGQFVQLTHRVPQNRVQSVLAWQVIKMLVFKKLSNQNSHKNRTLLI